MKGYDLTFDEKEFRAAAREAKRAAKRATPTRRERTTYNLARMAEDMGLGDVEYPLGRRAETARVAGGVANILDTELKRQHSDKRSNHVTRRETSTGSEVIVLTLDGVAYNLTVTRART